MALSTSSAAAQMAGLYLSRTVLRRGSLWWLLALAVVLTGAIVARLYGSRVEPDAAFRNITGMAVFGFVLPFMALHFGTAVVRDEMDAGTLTYLLVRPIGRGVFYLSRLSVAVLIVLLPTAAIASANAVVLGAGIGAIGLARVLLAVTLGATFYVSLFAALGAFFKRPFVIATIYLLLFELVVSLLPMPAKFATATANLLNIANLSAPAEGILARLGAAIPATNSALIVLTLAIISCGLGLLVFRWREYTPDTSNQA